MAAASTPTPLHRQIKVLHEALARIFFHAFKHKRNRQTLQAQQRDHAWRQGVPLQLQMAFSDLHTHLAGAQHKGMVAQCAGQGRQPFGFGGAHVALEALGVVGLHENNTCENRLQPPATGGQIASTSPLSRVVKR